MRLPHTLLTLITVAGALSAQDKDTGSKTPPKGPPWVLDFTEARTKALDSGKPIFVYSTKTY
ncbi:MAG TPA: hypothetical protein VF384_16145 [Planctomycetota bacterium]